MNAMCPLRDVEDILPIVLSFLDDASLLKAARCVSRKWYQAVTERQCSMFHFRGSYSVLASQSLCLRGRFASNGANARQLKKVKCVRGRLPAPRMDFDQGSATADSTVKACKGNLIYHSPSQLQQYRNNFVSMDLILALSAPDSGRVPISKANLSMVKSLKQVSSKGSSCLTDLSISGNVLGLDVSGSSRLKKLIVTSMELGSECKLQSLNLNGCRSLQTIDGPAWSKFSNNLQEVDLSLCTQFCRQEMAKLLQASNNLRNLSLRYVATDDILIALSNSKSAMKSLTLLDVAFSQDVTDRGVTALLEKAVHLKHLNLRACGNVSPQLYSDTPIQLRNRSAPKVGKQPTTKLDQCQTSLFELICENPPKKRQRTGELEMLPIVEQRKVVVF